MSTPEPTPQSEALRLHQMALQVTAHQLLAGTPPEQVVEQLLKAGMPRDPATALVAHVRSVMVEQAQKDAPGNMLWGSVWLFGGLLFTVLSYNAALASGGGSYAAASGAMVWGALQLWRGISQWFTR